MKKVVIFLILVVVFATACSATDYEKFSGEFSNIQFELRNLQNYKLERSTEGEDSIYSETGNSSGDIAIIDGDRQVDIVGDSGTICDAEGCTEVENLDKFQQVEINKVLNEITTISKRSSDLVEYNEESGITNFYSATENRAITLGFDFENKTITYTIENTVGNNVTYTIVYNRGIND